MKVLKWLGIVVGVLVLLVVVAAVTVFLKSNGEIRRVVTAPASSVTIPTDSASLAWGRHLVEAVGKCGDCHGADLGGQIAIDAKPFVVVAAHNLTRGRGGVGGTLTDAQWVNGIRHGIGPTGNRLILMPSEAYQYFDDSDLGAVIAYVKSVPAVDRELSAPAYGPIARGLLAAGKWPLYAYDIVDHARTGIAAKPAATDTVAYGRYLANAGGCTACHGPNLAGGPVPGMPPETPPAANLTPAGIGTYTEADFFRVLREGKRPGGTAVNEAMPWRASGLMTDDEVRAVWAFIRSMPAAEFGTR